MKLNIYGIAFHFVQVQMQDVEGGDQIEVGRRIFGRQTKTVAAQNQEDAVAFAVPEGGVVENVTNVMQDVDAAVEVANETGDDSELREELAEANDKFSKLAIQTAKLQDDLNAANEEIATLKASAEVNKPEQPAEPSAT